MCEKESDREASSEMWEGKRGFESVERRQIWRLNEREASVVSLGPLACSSQWAEPQLKGIC